MIMTSAHRAGQFVMFVVLTEISKQIPREKAVDTKTTPATFPAANVPGK